MIDINRIRNNKEEVRIALLKRMDNVNLDEVLMWDKEKRGRRDESHANFLACFTC